MLLLGETSPECRYRHHSFRSPEAIKRISRVISEWPPKAETTRDQLLTARGRIPLDAPVDVPNPPPVASQRGASGTRPLDGKDPSVIIVFS